MTSTEPPSLGNITDYPCIIHRGQKATHICTDFRCTNNPYLCALCFSTPSTKSLHATHEDSVLPISESIPELAMIIDGSKQQMARLFAATVSKKQYDPLLQKVDGGDRHYAQVDVHIKNLKSQVERQTQILCTQFQRRLQVSKQNIFSQLDNFQKMYVQNMETYKVLIEPLFSFNRRFKFFSNPNNISLKLLSEMKRKSAEWYLDLKRIMTSTTKILEKPQVSFEHINRSSIYMLGMGEDQMPRLLSPDVTDSRAMKIQLCVNDLLADLVHLKEPKSLHSFALEAENAIKGVNSNIIIANPSTTTTTTTPVKDDKNVTRLVFKKTAWGVSG